MPIYDLKELVNNKKSYLSRLNKNPNLGTSEFYCGGKQGGPKNNICGPTEGDNCVECVKLDIKIF
jgi:hypothetical protein